MEKLHKICFLQLLLCFIVKILAILGSGRAAIYIVLKNETERGQEFCNPN